MKKKRTQWDRAARALGLTLAPSPHPTGRMHLLGRPYYADEMVGVRGGLPVRVGTRADTVSSGEQTTLFFTYAKVDYGRSLDLGLSLTRSNTIARLWSAVSGSRDLQVGDPVIDPAFHILASEPELVRQLLTTPHVAEALRALIGAQLTPYVEDTSLRCERELKTLDPGTLGLLLDQTVDLAQRILAARATIGPSSTDHILQTAWRSVAEARGLQLDLAQTKMFGRYAGMYVEADTRLEGKQRWTAFTVRFDRPLGVGLRLTKQNGLSSMIQLIGVQDITVGDAVFDARFVVRGSPESAVRAVLTPEVRARLVDLQSHATTLEVADDRLVADVAWFVADAATLDGGLASVAAAGAALAGVVDPPAGPYRR